MKITVLFKEFFESEKTAGFILIFCTAVSLLLSNSSFSEQYLHFWHTDIANRPLEFWINDGLMTIFFLLVGLEIEREIYIGELSTFKNALLPFIAAIGGMIAPALIHTFFNYNTATQAGVGIPTATDIAFSLGILSLLGNKVPVSLKILLTAIAIIDDLGAIVVIALFYSKGFYFSYFLGAMGIFAIMLVMNRLKIYRIWMYLILGVGMWYCMLHSGIHATITGVLLAFAIPFGNGDEKSPSFNLQHYLHYPVAFIILPIFALANTGIVFSTDWTQNLWSSNSLGIFLGLVLGKPLGIVVFSLAAIYWGICTLPEDISKKHLVGVGFLAGIGFTMSIFITLLAFTDNNAVIVNSKIAVLLASMTAGIVGYVILKTCKNSQIP